MDKFYPLIHVKETHSTNSYLNELCEREEAPEFTVILADYQSAGRGQRGNSWESEPGKNLMFSYVLYPHFLTVQHQFLLSEIAALSVKELLDEYIDAVSIKWPNDIYWGQKKICGMLIENNLTGSHINRSINGVGININQESFHSSAPNPVSLKQITGKDYAPISLLHLFMEKLQAYYRLLQEGTFHTIDQRYRQALFRRDGYYTYRDKKETFKARMAGIEGDGKLLLQDEKGVIHKYMFKEVEYLL